MDIDSAKRIAEAIEALISAKAGTDMGVNPESVEAAKDLLMDALIDAE